MQEMTRGKNPRPKWDPAILLGVKDRKGVLGRVVHDPDTGKARQDPSILKDLAHRGNINGLGFVVRGAASAQAARE